jgi:hypothetical protein
MISKNPSSSRVTSRVSSLGRRERNQVSRNQNGEGPEANQRGGGREWMGTDKNSIQDFGLWTQNHLKTFVNFSCQIHVATGVLLDLGERFSQHPLKTRSGRQNKHNCWKPKPIRPVSETGQIDSLDLSLSQAGEPIRPVWQTGQAGFVQEIPKDLQDQNTTKPPQGPSRLRTGKAIAWRKFSCPTTLHDSPLRPNRSDRFEKPVRPVLPGQSGRTQPAKKIQPSPWSISRFASWIQVRLWG